MTPPLSDYQADQLRRLTENIERYPSAMEAGFATVYQQGVRDEDVPAVWRELRDLGAVTITLSDSIGRVRPVVQ